MSGLGRLFKYEMINLLRSRWIFLFAALSLTLSFTLVQITGDFEKSVVTLGAVTVVLVPLLSVLFASVSWYYSERFTQLLLTQPVPRSRVFLARITALLVALSLSFPVALGLPFLMRGYFSSGLLLVLAENFFLSAVFMLLGVINSLWVQDKIKGIGISLGIWIYFALVHDALGLLLLVLFKEFPMDLPSALVATLNPIGLARVAILIHEDAALLLGHTGALVREFLLGRGGMATAVILSLLWIVVPIGVSFRKFMRRDF
jgi:Cu-processing system permease protein